MHLPQLRSASQRVKRRLAPANASGLEDVLCKCGDVPSDWASLLPTNALFSSAGTRAEEVALDSAGRIRPNRSPHMKFKYLSRNGVQSADKALGYSRRVANQSESSLVRAVACEREFICVAMRILFTLDKPFGAASSPPVTHPESLSNALGGAPHLVSHGQRCSQSRNAVPARF